jgi:hypothetical protein
MATPPNVNVARVLPRTGPGTLTAPEARAILTVAFLSTEADDHLADEEEASFREVAAALRKLVGEKDASMSDPKLDAMLEEVAAKLDRDGEEAVLASVVPALERPLARELAYKVAVAMSLADLDKSDDERDFDDALVEALGLSEEQADTLAGDVYAALEN